MIPSNDGYKANQQCNPHKAKQKNIDLKAYSADIYEVHLFCAHCDPEGMGGKGGSIYTSTFSHDEAIARAQKFNHFCPTCGRKIDYNNIVKDFKIHLS